MSDGGFRGVLRAAGWTVLGLVVLAAACRPCHAYGIRDPLDEALIVHGFLQREGAFVGMPSGIGSVAGIFTGTVVGVFTGAVCVPYGLVVGETEEAFSAGFYAPVVVLGNVGGAIFGGPFYVVKKVVWDAPGWMFRQIFGDDEEEEEIEEVPKPLTSEELYLPDGYEPPKEEPKEE
jgi:hypothetical protein